MVATIIVPVILSLNIQELVDLSIAEFKRHTTVKKAYEDIK